MVPSPVSSVARPVSATLPSPVPSVSDHDYILTESMRFKDYYEGNVGFFRPCGEKSPASPRCWALSSGLGPPRGGSRCCLSTRRIHRRRRAAGRVRPPGRGRRPAHSPCNKDRNHSLTGGGFVTRRQVRQVPTHKHQYTS
jgi:hypothetical protein